MLFVDRRNRRADLVWAKALRTLPQERYAQTQLIHASIRVKTAFQVMKPVKIETLLIPQHRQHPSRALLLT